MRTSFAGSVLLATAVALPGLACGCAGNGAAADASTDYQGVQPAPDAGEGDAAGDDGGSVSITVRLANMSPDVGPLDFCWRVSGASAFTGPVLDGPGPDAGADAAQGAGDAGPDAGAPGDDAEAGDEASADATVDGGADATIEASVDAAPEAGDDASADSEPEATTDAGVEASADAGPDAGPVDAGGDAPGTTGDGGPPVQVAFGAMSTSVRLPASGTLDLALVPPGQLSCNGALFLGHVTVDAGKSATVVVTGLASVDAGSPSALSLTAYTDEPTDPQAAHVRFIHTALGAPGSSPAPAVSVRAGGAVLAPEVDPGQVTSPSTNPPVDALGYLTAPTVATATPLELDALGDGGAHTWTSAFTSLDVRSGTTHTGFVVSLPQGALGVAWCTDISSVAGPPACRLLPAR